MPDAAMLVVGNEILSGRTREANLQVLAKSLRARGIPLAECRMVPDREEDIVSAVNLLRSAHRYFFTSGGIGPTHDDITTASVAKALGVPVVRHPQAVSVLREYYARSGRQATESRMRMADAPQGAELVFCARSAAPGYRIGGMFVFAGVPFIFESMVAAVMPSIEKRAAICSRTILVRNGESEVAGILERVQGEFADLELGSYPKIQDGEYLVELVVSGSDNERIGMALGRLGGALEKNGFEWMRME